MILTGYLRCTSSMHVYMCHACMLYARHSCEPLADVRLAEHAQRSGMWHGLLYSCIQRKADTQVLESCINKWGI